MFRRHLPPISGASSSSNATPSTPTSPHPSFTGATRAPQYLQTFGRHNNLVVRNVESRQHEVMRPLTTQASHTERAIYMRSAVSALAENDAYLADLGKAGGLDHVRDSMRRAGCSSQDRTNYLKPIMAEWQRQLTRWAEMHCLLLPTDIDPLVMRLKGKGAEILFDLVTAEGNVEMRVEYQKAAKESRRSHMETLHAIAEEYKDKAQRFIRSDDNFHDILTEVSDVAYNGDSSESTIGAEFRRIARIVDSTETAMRIVNDTWDRAGQEFMNNLMNVEWSLQIAGNVAGPMRAQFIRTFNDPAMIERRADHIATHVRLQVQEASEVHPVLAEPDHDGNPPEAKIVMEGILVPAAHITIDKQACVKLKDPVIGECLREVAQMTLPQMYQRAIKIKGKIINIELSESEKEQDLLKEIRILEIIEANLPNGLLRKLQAEFGK